MSVDVQIFTVASSPGNWTKPSWAKVVRVVCIGGGGGGGGGDTAASGVIARGGGGGGGASRSEVWYDADDLGTTEP